MKTENCTQLSISRWSDDGRNVGRHFVYRHATKCKEEQTTETTTKIVSKLRTDKEMWPDSEQRNVTKLRTNKEMWPNAEQTKKCDQTQNKELWPNAEQRNVNKQENNQIKNHS